MRDDRDPHTKFRPTHSTTATLEASPPSLLSSLLPAPMPSLGSVPGAPLSSSNLPSVLFVLLCHFPLSFQQGQAEQNTSSMCSASSLREDSLPCPGILSQDTILSGRKPLSYPHSQGTICTWSTWVDKKGRCPTAWPSLLRRGPAPKLQVGRTGHLLCGRGQDFGHVSLNPHQSENITFCYGTQEKGKGVPRARAMSPRSGPTRSQCCSELYFCG